MARKGRHKRRPAGPARPRLSDEVALGLEEDEALIEQKRWAGARELLEELDELYRDRARRAAARRRGRGASSGRAAPLAPPHAPRRVRGARRHRDGAAARPGRPDRGRPVARYPERIQPRAPGAGELALTDRRRRRPAAARPRDRAEALRPERVPDGHRVVAL